MTEEREHREKETEETEERMRMMQQQMEALQKLVAESSKREEKKSEMEQLKLMKLTDQHDIEAFLTIFERMMGVFGIEKNRWALKLAPQLTGKAQKVFAAMEESEASDHDQLKKAILKRYNISGETYRQRLRTTVRKSDESNRKMATRVMELVQKWMAECTTVQKVLEVVRTEQLLNSMGEEVCIWVRERKPKTCAEAGELVDDYELARKTGKVDMNRKSGEKKQQSGSPARCFSCGQVGHRVLEYGKNRRVGERGAARPVGVQERRPPTNQTWREPRYYECGKLGHFSMRCPSKALFSEGRGSGRETTNQGEAVLFAAQVWSMGRPLQTLGWIQGKSGQMASDGAESSVADVLRMLAEDRKKRENWQKS